MHLFLEIERPRNILHYPKLKKHKIMKKLILSTFLFMSSIALMAQEYTASYNSSSKILFQEDSKSVSEFILRTTEKEVTEMQNKMLPYAKEMSLTFTKISKDNYDVKLIFIPKIDVNYVVKIFTFLNITHFTLNGNTTSISELSSQEIK